ncbi:MAG TPA: hypothetical protein DDW52_04090 [Planctomycetaceae bacterium]|nr:hypothetical protein [Planctomycetaceae bacterium]
MLFTPAVAQETAPTARSSTKAANSAKLIFHDDFQRNESQEEREELGGKWSTNSTKRANGNKQLDLRDGALYIYRHKTADHGVSLVHPAKYRDCRVELRFRLDERSDDIGIDFADLTCKEVHAGHICKVNFRPDGIEILDFKYGRMKKSYRDAARAGKATEAQKTEAAKFQRKFKQAIELGKWHSAVVTIRSDTLSVSLDGKDVGSFRSPGIAHPAKDTIRFSARANAWMDDVKMVALTEPT